MRFLAAGFWVVGGVMHFVIPHQYEAIVPAALREWRKEIVVASGIAEIAGGLLILPERTRRAGRWWSLATLAAVYPANIEMAVIRCPVQRSSTGRCLVAPRWVEALEAGVAPRVALLSTHEGALHYTDLATLKRYALDLS